MRIYPARRRITRAEKRRTVMEDRDMPRSIFSHSDDADLNHMKWGSSMFSAGG